MGKIPRNDYAGSADVAKNNEVLKRVNTQNSPYSVQATGHVHYKDKYIPVTSENIDALEGGERVLDANSKKTVKTVTKEQVETAPGSGVFEDGDATVSIVVTQDVEGQFIDTTYTKEELLASGTIFFATEG